MNDALLRKRAFILKTLLTKYGSSNYSNLSFYKCADEWIEKQVTSAGIVSYFKAYYNK